MQSKGGQCCRQEGFSQNQPGSPSCPSLKVPELCESCEKEREGQGTNGATPLGHLWRSGCTSQVFVT